MESEKQKSCLIESHQNEHLCLICIDPHCQIPSRTACQECIVDEKFNHQSCQTFLFFTKKEESKIKLLDKNQMKLQGIYHEILKYEQENTNRIEAEFQNLLINITELINQTKKNIKIKIMDKFAKIKEEIETHFEYQSRFQDLKELEQNIDYFHNKIIDIDDLNSQIVKKQISDTSIQKFSTIESNFYQKLNNSYKIFDIQEFKSQISSNMNHTCQEYDVQNPSSQKQIQFQIQMQQFTEQKQQQLYSKELSIKEKDNTCIKQIQQIPMQNQQNQIVQENKQQYSQQQEWQQQQQLQYQQLQLQQRSQQQQQKQQYQQKQWNSKEIIPFKNFKNLFQKENNGVKLLKNNEIQFMLSPFTKKQNIHIKFRLDYLIDKKSFSYIGLIPSIHSQGQSSINYSKCGNYLCLSKDNSQTHFKKTGILINNQHWQKGQVYTVEILVEKNIFDISSYSSKNKNMGQMINLVNFNKDHTNWSIVFDIGKGVKFTLL